MLARLGSLLRALTGRRRFEDGLSEELRFHLDQHTDDLVRQGVPPEEARRRARMDLGSLDSVKDDCREATGLRIADAVRRDLRHTARALRRSPGFTLTAIATLGVCLGANLTIFAVVDAVLLRPLPFPAADRLVSVFNTYPNAGVPDDGCSLTNYYERRGRIAELAGVSAYREVSAALGDAGATERVAALRVSPEFFDTLGLTPVRGRAFTEAESARGADAVAVVTDAFWRSRLGADPAALGRTVRVNGRAVRVVGVLPAAFQFLSSKAVIYFPLASDPEERSPANRHSGNSRMVARLRPGATIEAAQAGIDAHNAAVEIDDPMAKAMAAAGFRSVVVPLQRNHVAAVRPVLTLVQAGALLLLFVGVFNLVNLMLVRVSARARERAVRRAIGAGRRDVVTEVLAETLVLTTAGGVVGLLLGSAGVRLVGVFGAGELPLGARVVLDGRVAGVALVAALALGLIMAGPIAWFSLRDRSMTLLAGQSRSTTAGRLAERLRHGFIVAQIALAFVVLAGAGLLGLSLERAMSMAPGFRPDHVMTGRLTVSNQLFPTRASLLAFVDDLVRDVARQPGVQAVGISTNVPLSGVDNRSAVTVKGYAPGPRQSLQAHFSYSVGGDFFAAMGMTLLEGRFLTADDSHQPRRVCVVDDDFARHYWPDRNAIGQRVFAGPTEGPDADAFTIVGIVSPMKQGALTDVAPQGAAYFPFGHRPDGDFHVVVRASVDAESLGGALQRVVRRINPELPVSDWLPMETRITNSLAARRSPALLSGVFSAIALLLSAIGTYGVVSFAVGQRRREIALRMALGADPAHVGRAFVRLSMRLLAGGLAFGLLGVWLASRAVEAVLFQVSSLDAATLAAATAVLGIVSVAACLVPAWRAARVSPMEAMGAD